MQINHHLSDELLMAYSAGILPEAFSLVVATHISMCDECRARLASFDAIGGAMMDQAAGADVSDDSFASTLKLISDGPKDAILTERVPASKVPAPLHQYLPEGGLDAIRWRSVGMGVKQAILPTSKDASVRLLKIPAGVAVPDHGHRGTELTLVLQGAFRDDHDRFGPGDLEIADEDMHHTPVAEDGEDCICLAATDAPLRFNGLLPRIAQPFVGI